MRLFDVVFGNTLSEDIDYPTGKLCFQEYESNNAKNKKKQTSIYLENDLTQQRYYFDKTAFPDALNEHKGKSNPLFSAKPFTRYRVGNETSSENLYAISTYELNGVILEDDVRNRNLIFKKPANIIAHTDVLILSINQKDYKLVSYNLIGGQIVQTGRHGDYIRCAISISSVLNDDENLIVSKGADRPIISFVISSVKDGSIGRYTIALDEGEVIINRFDLITYDPVNYLRYTEMLTDDNFYKSFKLSPFKGIDTEVVIISDKYTEDVDEDNIPNVIADADDVRESIKQVVSCDAKNPDLDENMMNDVLIKNHIRTITTIGVNLPKDFCKKYKILYILNYDPKSGVSVCSKSN